MSSDDPSPYTPDRGWAADYAPGATFAAFTDLDRYPDWEFLLAGLNRDISWASLRPFRHGGYVASDRAHQQQLFLVVGAIAVAGAQAETDMKRILLAHDPDRTKHLSDTHWRWSQLMAALRTLAQGDDEMTDLRKVLTWADEHDVEEIRNGAVHSYWWLFDVGHVHRGRIRTAGSREQDTAVVGTWDDYFNQIDVMFEFAARLQAIVPWPTAILPPLDHPGLLNERVRWPHAPDLAGTVQESGEET